MRNIGTKLTSWLVVLSGLVFLSLLVALALVVLDSRATDRKPPFTETSIQLNPATGQPGTLFTVSGRGWQAGEMVLVYLVEVESGATDGVVYASAVATGDGQIVAQLRYPQDGLWAGKQSAIIEARGGTSARVARAALQVQQPTLQPVTDTPIPATDTPVPTVPPTVTPTTEPPTTTPTPVPPSVTPTRIPPTPTPQPPKPTPVQITDWRGEYYDNVNLAGSPLVRNDRAGTGPGINFEWGTGSPMRGIPPDGFSVRWTRRLSFEAKTYRFHVRVDDGARLWVDGQLVIDQWLDGSPRTFAVERTLTQGVHDLRLEMYERTGQAVAALWWEEVRSYPDWKGEYFANTALSGSPVLVRNDRGIDFRWGEGAPAAGLPTDNFGVRWTRQLHFPTGNHRFFVEVDDGVRLWVDGLLVINQWHDGVGSYSGDIYLTEGLHTVRMEMYEHTGAAMARMWWALQTSYPDWKGHYFANRDLKGTPVLVRNDVTIDFNWGAGAPAPSLAADDFSVKWTRNMDFADGVYRFCATADDGVSVEMDDSLPYILREWHDGSGTYCKEVHVVGGRHKVTVEYFEHLGGAMIQFWWKRVEIKEVPSHLTRQARASLWAPTSAYGVLASEAEYAAFLQQNGIQTDQSAGEPTPFDWETEIGIVAFLGEQPTTGYVVDLTRITYGESKVTIHLRITQPAPDESVSQVVSSPYALIGVQRSAVPKGKLTFTFVDQNGGLRGQGTVIVPTAP